MSNPVLTISPTGRINRRDKVNEGDFNQVLDRRNLRVVGIGESKKLCKLPGSDRYNSSAFTGTASSGKRYYTKGGFKRTFFFAKGSLYYIDNLGNVTTILSVFSQTAIPCWEIMTVAGNDLLIFSEGVNTGLYSYDGNLTPSFQYESQNTLNFVGMVGFLDRLWGFEEDSDTLYYSKTLEPFNFTDSTDAGSIRIAPKRGSKIQSIMILNQALYVFKEDEICVIEGRTPSEFYVREVITQRGVSARHSVVSVEEDNIFFFGSDFEIYSFNGQSLKLITHEISLGGDKSARLNALIDTSTQHLQTMQAEYYDHMYRLCCRSIDAPTDNNNFEYFFDTYNETDGLTEGNNVSCYIKYDKDEKVLVTGRSDAGYLMFQERGYNWDNQASSPTMRVKLNTKSVGGFTNKRFLKAWLDSEIRYKEPLNLNYYVDTRFSGSDARNNDFAQWGESKSPTTAITLASQTSVSGRSVLQRRSSRGQNISFELDQNKSNLDLSFSKIHVEYIDAEKKRNQRVGV